MSSTPSRSGSASAASSHNAIKRLSKELAVWKKESATETGIERLEPVSDDEMLHWEAVINGRGIGCGYDGSFSSLSLSLPSFPSTLLLPPSSHYPSQ